MGDVMKKDAHHMWNAETDNDGKVVVNRTNAEREDLDEYEFARQVSASAWGLFGASLLDEVGSIRASKMPQAVKDRMAVVANELKEAGDFGPEVKSWDQLDREYDKDTMEELRGYVAHGMKTRQASKFFNLPFVATADILEDAEVIGKKAMKDIVDRVKTGKADEAVEDYGTPAAKVASVYEEAKQGLCKMAVDESAKAYWESYYGEYGEQLVKDVKKRVKADVAFEWLTKCGVDQACADYWQSYFTEGGYGKALTEFLPKKLSPSDSKKED